jgi:hypothetical protein
MRRREAFSPPPRWPGEARASDVHRSRCRDASSGFFGGPLFDSAQLLMMYQDDVAETETVELPI